MAARSAILGSLSVWLLRSVCITVACVFISLTLFQDWSRPTLRKEWIRRLDRPQPSHGYRCAQMDISPSIVFAAFAR